MYLRAILCTFQIFTIHLWVGEEGGEGAGERGVECMGTVSVLTVPIQLVTHTVSVLSVLAIF
jgi:hypothetical protein